MIFTSSNYRTFKYKKRWGKRAQQFKHTKGVKKVKFHENPRPHIMYHADTMEVTLGNRSLIHQISVEDDYSRGYMALCVFPKKHTYFVILTLLRAFRLHRKPKLFHHDNGGEYNNGVVSRLLRMRDVVDVPTEIESPKGIKGAVGTVCIRSWAGSFGINAIPQFGHRLCLTC